MPTVSCPHCGMTQTIPHHLVGEDVDCPKCGVDFTAELDDRPVGGRVNEETDSLLAERRRRKAQKQLLTRLAIVGILSLAVMSVFTAIISMNRRKAAEDETARADPHPKPLPARAQQAVQLQPRPQPQPQIPPEPRRGKDTDLRGRADGFPAPARSAGPPAGNPFFDPAHTPPGHDPFAGPPPGNPVQHPDDGLRGDATPLPVDPGIPFVCDRPAKEAFPGYYERKVHGFKVYVSRLAYENSDERRGTPLKLVDDELARIVDLFPPDTVKGVRQWPVWVEWDHTIPRSVRAFAVYYGSRGEGLFLQGVDPRKADCVCILSLKTAVALKARGGKQNTLLHEFAHLVHAKVYKDNTFIRNAYQQAMARGLYDRLRHDDGTTRAGYAAQNEHEYFAEITCAYLDRLDYPPHARKDLREFDSVGYQLMTKVWGTPEQIAELKKKAAQRSPSKKGKR